MKKYKCDCGNSKLEACEVVIRIHGMPLTIHKGDIEYDDTKGQSDEWEPFGQAVICASCGKRYTIYSHAGYYFLKGEK